MIFFPSLKIKQACKQGLEQLKLQSVHWHLKCSHFAIHISLFWLVRTLHLRHSPNIHKVKESQRDVEPFTSVNFYF